MAPMSGRYRPRWIKMLKCKLCGEEFEATRRDALYCKPACRQTASRSARGLATLAVMVKSTNAPKLAEKMSQNSPSPSPAKPVTKPKKKGKKK